MTRTGKSRSGASSFYAGLLAAFVVLLIALGYSYESNLTLTAQMSSLSTSLSSQGSEISSMRSSLGSQNAQISGLQSTMGSLQAQLATLSGQLNSLQASDSAALLRLSNEVASLNASIRQLIAQITTPTPAAPGLVQQAQSTCSYVCSAQLANVTFSAGVRQGDVLVVTLVADDVAPLTISDSLGTNLNLTVRAISSACSTSNSGACEAEIFSGVLPASGRDSVVVREIDLGVALRVQAWEFHGFSGVGKTDACSPTCPLVSYPSGAALIATARDVSGAGPGFTWYPYQASGVAGSEYQIATSAGSTTFPFSAAVNDAEAAAVLVPSPGG